MEFNPANVAAYRLIGYENRRLRDEDFNDDTKDAGEIGVGHSVTALYEVVPAGVPVPTGEVDPLRYRAAPTNGPKTDREAVFSDELLSVKLRYKEPDGDHSRLLTHHVPNAGSGLAQASEDLRFATAVAMFGMLLRSSDFAGDASYDRAFEMARRAVGDDPHGYRSEFVRLVSLARDLPAGSEATQGNL